MLDAAESPPEAVAALLADIAQRHPRSHRGALEARQLDAPAFDRTTARFVRWLTQARGPGGLADAVDAYAEFCAAVNLAQARYEASGAYPNKTHADCLDALYGTDAMHGYLWGVYLTTVLWPHHLRLLTEYERQFVAHLPAGARVAELACGHGGWGLHALAERSDLTLQGWDIAPAGIEIATGLAKAAGLSGRAAYRRADVLALPADAGPVDAVVCCFLLEHLDEPAALMNAVATLLPPGGVAWVTGALTAAQSDHIYEFVRESELVLLAEQAGFSVTSTMSAHPPRTLPRARFLPRSMALVLRRRAGPGR